MIQQGKRLTLDQADVIRDLVHRRERIEVISKYEKLTEGMVNHFLQLTRPVTADYVRPLEEMLHIAKKRHQKHGITLKA